MRRSYKYRLFLTDKQAGMAQTQVNIAREVYNACLEERRACYRVTGQSLTYYDQANQLKEIRRVCPDVATANYSMLQATCRRAQRAYDTFYRRVKAGMTGGLPRFKSCHHFDSITFPSYGDGCKLTGTRLKLQGIGSVKVKLHRPVEGTIKTVTLKREADKEPLKINFPFWSPRSSVRGSTAAGSYFLTSPKWYVVFSCAVEATPVPATGQAVGIDVGLTHFLTTDTGATVENPRPFKRAQRRLRVAQRALARCKRGSVRRGKARRRVAALHQKVAHTRKDFQHKTARVLVDAYDTIYHEDLAVANMVKNHKLAKAITDAAWSQFIVVLTSKAEGAGRP